MQVRSFLTVASALLAATCVSARAQEMPLTLARAVEQAQLHAPAARGAEAALRAADAGVEVAGQRPNPSLSVETENVLGSGRYAGFGGGERTTSLSLPVELGGKRQARINLAESERSAARIGAVATRADITQRVTEAFIGVAAAEQRLATARTTLSLAEQALHVAQERVRAGKASPIEEQRAQVVRVNAGVRLGKSERALTLAQADLARLTGIQNAISIAAPWFASVPPSATAGADRGSLLPVDMAQAQAQAALARIDVAKRERIPDVTITAGTRRYGDSSDRAAVLALSIPLPLFNRGTAALSRSQADYDRAVAERDSVAAETQQALAHAEADVADARAAAMAANGPALAAAMEAARIARIGYTEGKFPQLELIESERSLTETREAAVEALAAFHLAQARLARLQGTAHPIYKD